MKNHKGIFLNLHTENDKHIIEKLDKVSNKQGYIKELVQADSKIYKVMEKGENHG